MSERGSESACLCIRHLNGQGTVVPAIFVRPSVIYHVCEFYDI
jgi:hypothetical protein